MVLLWTLMGCNAETPSPSPAPAAGQVDVTDTPADVRRRLDLVASWGDSIQDPRVLAAMRRVRRHAFCPPRLREVAYEDRPLPIGAGQTISQPWVVARMTELLQVKPGDRVLEVGTGSGYQAAVLADMGCEVYTIEIIPALSERARAVLEALGYKNVHTRVGDGYAGWPEAAPFDAIVVTAAVDHVPAPLLTQLKVGGRLVLPLGPAGGVQFLTRVTRTPTGVRRERFAPVRFVPMTGEALKGNRKR